VLIARAGDRFQDGRLTDGETRDFLRNFMAQFADWARAHR
jgi:hypothetical protein